MRTSDDRRCYTQILMRNGNGYMVFEKFADIVEEIGLGSRLLELRTWSGSDLMPPTALAVVVGEISSVQEMSLEDWTWSKHATELHYSKQLRDLEGTDTQTMLATQQRLVDTLARRDEEDD